MLFIGIIGKGMSIKIYIIIFIIENYDNINISKIIKINMYIDVYLYIKF